MKRNLFLGLFLCFNLTFAQVENFSQAAGADEGPEFFAGPIAQFSLFTESAGDPNNFFNGFAGVTFDLVNEGDVPIVITELLVPVEDGGTKLDIDIYYTTTASTNVGVHTDPGAWTLLESLADLPKNNATSDWNPENFTRVELNNTLTLEGGQSKGIYLLVTNYDSDGVSYRYTDGNFTASNGTLTILSNGYGSRQTPFDNTFADRAFVGEVTYRINGSFGDCNLVGANSEFIDGQSIAKHLNRIVAHDITVSAGEDMVLEGLEVHVISEDNEIVDYADVYIYEDNNGTPGNVVAMFSEIEPVSQDHVGVNGAYNLHNVKFDLPSTLLLGNENSDTSYWIGISAQTENDYNLFWEYKQNTMIGEYGLNYFDGDSGSWEYWATNEGVYTFIANCTANLSTNDPVASEVSVYPNPVQDVVNIVTDKNIDTVVVFNITGQQVLKTPAAGGQINLDSLSPGIYLMKVALDTGHTSTIKLIKN